MHIWVFGSLLAWEIRINWIIRRNIWVTSLNWNELLKSFGISKNLFIINHNLRILNLRRLNLLTNYPQVKTFKTKVVDWSLNSHVILQMNRMDKTFVGFNFLWKIVTDTLVSIFVTEWSHKQGFCELKTSFYRSSTQLKVSFP